jgi:hypothetical protein
LPINFAVKYAACFVLAGSFPMCCAAQAPDPAGSDSSRQQSQPPAQGQTPPAGEQQPPAQQQPQDKDPVKPKDQTESGQGKVQGTSNDRLFYTLPNFLTLQGAHQLPPLSVKDKYKVVALGTFDVVEYPWWGVIAAIGQANNSDPAFGQGWPAYAKRYGITGGDAMVENFMVGAVFPSILRQDPRYYQSGRGSFLRRTGYSISRIFVTLSDSGHTQFNFSEIFGAYTAACISTYTYHPKSTFISTPSNPHEFISSERTFGNTISTWGTQISLDTLTLVVKEFWPDIHRKMAKHKSGATAAANSKP